MKSILHIKNKTRFLSILICGSVGFLPCAYAEWNEAESIKDTLRWSVLTPTYGITLTKDLKRWATHFRTSQYNELHPEGMYFQCFESRDVLAYCEVSEEVYNSDIGGYPSTFSVDAFLDDGKVESYLARKVIAIDDCMKIAKHARSIIKRSTHVCLGGEGTSYNFKEDGKVRTWIWDRLRTETESDGWWNES